MKEQLRSLSRSVVRFFERYGILLLFVVGIVVRFVALSSFPGGMNQDEVSAGYDSFALLSGGTDRHGIPWPVVLPAWGPGMNSLASYIQMPFIAIFGLTTFAIRLPFAITGCITLFLFHRFLQCIADKKTAVLGLLLLVISPWHIALSRWGLEANLLPLFFLIGAYGTAVALIEGRKSGLYGAAAGFGLSLYTYGTAYVALPVFLVTFLLFMMLRPRSNATTIPRHVWYESATILLALAAPIIFFIQINSSHLGNLSLGPITVPELPTNAQFLRASLLASAHPIRDGWNNLYGLLHMLVHQNDGTFYNVLPGYGILYAASAPLAALGFVSAIIAMIRRKRHVGMSILFSWFIAGLAVGTLVAVNINRANIIMLPFVAFTTLGLRVLARWRPVLAVACAYFAVSFVMFLYAYFVTYVPHLHWRFQSGLTEALTAASMTEGKICVTDQAVMPYIYALFAAKIPPERYYATVQFIDPKRSFQEVRSFDRYTFGLPHCPDDISTYVLTTREGAQARFADDTTFSKQTFESYVTITKHGF